ncbi:MULTISPECIES: hypothetical protein [unclassified Microcoleus]|uniref:hypothetical protein n=1 Tax=unclassified Microcoleus TaxID=2642155 RepID=UPI00403F033D
MNSLLLISSDRGSGFKPILSGNSNANAGKIAAARVNRSRSPSRHLILNKGVFCVRLGFVWLQPSSSIPSDSHLHLHNAV